MRTVFFFCFAQFDYPFIERNFPHFLLIFYSAVIRGDRRRSRKKEEEKWRKVFL